MLRYGSDRAIVGGRLLSLGHRFSLGGVHMKRATAVRTARFLVEPLHFEHTVLGLAHQLAAVPGVRRVELDARTGHVDIDFDAGATTHQRLERTICDCGYDCTCPSGAERSTSGRDDNAEARP
jgi:copper chaperone CopZ